MKVIAAFIFDEPDARKRHVNSTVALSGTVRSVDRTRDGMLVTLERVEGNNASAAAYFKGANEAEALQLTVRSHVNLRGRLTNGTLLQGTVILTLTDCELSPAP